jgi:hypothetical protein
MRRRFCAAFVIAAASCLNSAPISSIADTSAATAYHRYADGTALAYHFDGTAGNLVPSWLQSVTNLVLPTDWSSNNNSPAPTFQFSTTGTGRISYTQTPFGMTRCLGTVGWTTWLADWSSVVITSAASRNNWSGAFSEKPGQHAMI